VSSSSVRGSPFTVSATVARWASMSRDGTGSAPRARQPAHRR
jgi:hypothetical protein